MKKFRQSYPYIALGVFVFLLLLTLEQNVFGMVGLGTLLIVSSMWSVVRSKQIWKDYRARYRVRKKSQKSMWTEPRQVYYYLHLFLVAPLMIAFGIILLCLAAFISYPN